MRTLAALSGLVGCGGGMVGDGDGVVDLDEVPGVGWRATLEGTAHDVAGEAVLVDDGDGGLAIEVRDFVYDGGGLNARFFLLADGEAFHRDHELTDNLVGSPSNGETLVLPVSADSPPDDWNLITLWCIPANVSFGSGVFEPPEG